MIILEAQRLLLRHFTFDDLDDLAIIQADPDTMRFLPAGPRSPEQTRQDIERAIARQAQYGFSLWATVHQADNRLIGSTDREEVRDHLPRTGCGDVGVDPIVRVCLAVRCDEPANEIGAAVEAASELRNNCNERLVQQFGG